MTSTHFFISRKNLQSPSVLLEGSEHHHLKRVLRIRPGDKVWLFDEKGCRYQAIVEDVASDKTRLLIFEKVEAEERKIEISLAQALLKSKKMDFLVQKAAEFGIAAFIPVLSTRSVVKLGERTEKKVERWRKIAQQAAKQCRSGRVPSVSLPVSFSQVVAGRRETRKLLLSENQGILLKDILALDSEGKDAKTLSSVIVLIGPEGGWTREEEEYALGFGFDKISLGSHILRSETAALAALALLSHYWIW